MNEDCENVSCTLPNNAVQDYLNQYSLENIIVQNAEYSTVINGVAVTVPAGTFTYSVTANPAFNTLTFQGCNSVISIPIPPGSSFSQIQALVQQMLNQAAQQHAQCVVDDSGNLPPPAFVNQQVSVASTCTVPGLEINGSLPPGVMQSGNSLVCAAGIVASNVSQAAADQAARQFLQNLLDQLFSTGKAICGCTFDCTPDTGPVPPGFADGPAAAPGAIKNYDLCVKPIFMAAYASCSGCGVIPDFEAWDGSLPNVTCGLGNIWYCINFTAGLHNLSIQVISDDHFWYIDIYCDSPNPLWRGRKDVGNDATGKYIQVQPGDPIYDPMCATQLPCLEII
jgi:hypothetical protein